MSDVVDYERMAALYDAGRAVPGEWLKEWREALGPYLSEVDGPLLDAGSGTGIWSLLLAQWFGLRVVGLEPSAGMRAEAVLKRSHRLVAYVGGEAEHLPFVDDAFEAVWMSTVIHHIPDLQRAAQEVRRVLAPGGPVLIRNPFRGRHQGILWTHFFPAALRLAEERHPSVEETVTAFSAAGFEEDSLRTVSQVAASTLDDYVARIETRSDSSLRLIEDDEFARGLAALRGIGTRGDRRSSGPVTAALDLLVLR